MTPSHPNPAQWQQALGYSRQACARVFRDGGSPEDALDAFGLSSLNEDGNQDWSRAVEHIADALCANNSDIHKAA